MKNFWDERYSSSEFVYGTQPNQFFKEQIDRLLPGKLLMIGEGEGRNSIYAAKLGWQVDAIDGSSVAQEKALNFANKNNVKINYIVSDFYSYDFPENIYDAIGIIFVHTHENSNNVFYQNLADSLKKGGRIILELFSHNQLGKTSGGPQDLSLLSSIDKIKNGFPALKHEILKDENIILTEGDFHQGEASVIRFVGVK
jgi:SAM-dependent methyltransferase